MAVVVVLGGVVLWARLHPGTDKPLHSAVIAGDLPAVRLLVNAGAKLNAKGEFARTPLYYAALSDHPDVLAYLLEKGADPKKGASWKSNNTPLHVAAENGHLACVKILLSAKVPVDIRNSVDHTPLHLAAREQQVEVVKALLEHGADVNARDYMRTAPLAYPSGAFGEPRPDYRETVETLLAHGADASHADRNGETALHEAVFRADPAVVELLLKRGADPNVSGIRGTPLSWAREKRQEKIIESLVKFGARE